MMTRTYIKNNYRPSRRKKNFKRAYKFFEAENNQTKPVGLAQAYN